MSESFDLEGPEHFTAGTVGPPGHRVFYLQAGADGRLVTLKVEKQQVAALADYLAGILEDLPPAPGTEAAAEGADLIEPVLPEWTVGSLGVAWDEAADRVVLVAEELVLESDDEDDDDEPGEDEPPKGATTRLLLTRAQVATFVETARDLVAAGRPPCPFCGGPLDPTGHVCPRMNGHARR